MKSNVKKSAAKPADKAQKKPAAQAQAIATLPPAQELVTTGYGAASGIIAVIEAAAKNPRVNVDKMERLLNMQLTIMQKQAEMAYTTAMMRLQTKLPRITKNGLIAFTDKGGNERKTPYARYEDIDKVIRPLMLDEGFVIDFDTRWDKDGATIVGSITHDSGHKRSSEIRLPLDTSGSKNTLQAMGSTISYGQRYLVKMLLNLIFEGEDNDGADFNKKENEIDPFTGKAVKQPGGVVLEGNVTLSEQVEQMKKDLQATKTKKARLKIISENAGFLQALDGNGMSRAISDIHALADEGV